MSIRRYLVLMLLSIITLIIFVSAIQGYKASMSKAESLFDDELVSLAQVISAITLPKGVVKHKVTSNFAYQVVMDEQVIIRSENAPQRLINKLNNGFKVNVNKVNINLEHIKNTLLKGNCSAIILSNAHYSQAELDEISRCAAIGKTQCILLQKSATQQLH